MLDQITFFQVLLADGDCLCECGAGETGDAAFVSRYRMRGVRKLREREKERETITWGNVHVLVFFAFRDRFGVRVRWRVRSQDTRRVRTV